MDALLHWPIKENPDYEAEEGWREEAAALEDRMERFAREARRLEVLADDYEEGGDLVMAFTCSEMANNMWVEHRRLQNEVNDLEGGF